MAFVWYASHEGLKSWRENPNVHCFQNGKKKREAWMRLRMVNFLATRPASSTLVSLINHQSAVLSSNQPVVLFSQNKPALATSHQPNKQAASSRLYLFLCCSELLPYIDEINDLNPPFSLYIPYVCVDGINNYI
jgi:hypothetical protein